MHVWDVVVVGAGPAGAAAALSARHSRPEASVLLLDRADFPRDKPCGDGVAPQAVEILRRLGVDHVGAGFGDVARLVVEGPGGAAARRRMARPATVVPRTVFDARIAAAAAQAGAVLRRHTVRSVRTCPGGAVVDDAIHARTLIGADGANGVVRREVGVGAQPHGHMGIALRGYAPDGSDEDEPTQIIRMDASERWPAYAWSFPLADGTGRANVGYGTLVDADRRVSRRELVDGMHRMVPWSRAAVDLRAHHLPLSSWRPRQPDGPVLLAGDAASLVNPFTGEGIYYAVLSGALAGRASVRSRTPAATYRASLRHSLARHHRDAGLLRRVVRSPRLVDAGIRAAADDQRVFDDVVAMGLADGTLTSRLLRGTAGSLLRGA